MGMPAARHTSRRSSAESLPLNAFERGSLRRQDDGGDGIENGREVVEDGEGGIDLDLGGRALELDDGGPRHRDVDRDAPMLELARELVTFALLELTDGDGAGEEVAVKRAVDDDREVGDVEGGADEGVDRVLSSTSVEKSRLKSTAIALSMPTPASSWE